MVETAPIGPLGGPEVAQVKVGSGRTVSIPEGWKKAAGVIKAKIEEGDSLELFGSPVTASETRTYSGGGVFTAGETATPYYASALTQMRGPMLRTVTWVRME